MCLQYWGGGELPWPLPSSPPPPPPPPSFLCAWDSLVSCYDRSKRCGVSSRIELFLCYSTCTYDKLWKCAKKALLAAHELMNLLLCWTNSFLQRSITGGYWHAVLTTRFLVATMFEGKTRAIKYCVCTMLWWYCRIHFYDIAYYAKPQLMLYKLC